MPCPRASRTPSCPKRMQPQARVTAAPQATENHQAVRVTELDFSPRRRKETLLPEIAELSLEGHSSRSIWQELASAAERRSLAAGTAAAMGRDAAESCRMAVVAGPAGKRSTGRRWRSAPLAGRQADDGGNVRRRRRRRRERLAAKDDSIGPGRPAGQGHPRRQETRGSSRSTSAGLAKAARNGALPRAVRPTVTNCKWPSQGGVSRDRGNAPARPQQANAKGVLGGFSAAV